MRTLIVVALMLILGGGAASADLTDWQIACQITDDGGHDAVCRFGVDPDGTWDYDGRDAVHPGFGEEDWALVFSDLYWEVYEGEFGRQDYGWPPSWKPWIPPDARPDYPIPGLIRDTREPVLGYFEPEFWLMRVQAPNPGGTFSFSWSSGVLEDMRVTVWTNHALRAAGVVGDLVLMGPGVEGGRVDGIPCDYTPMCWVIQAQLVPEPGAVQMAGLLLALGGIALARLRRG